MCSMCLSNPNEEGLHHISFDEDSTGCRGSGPPLVPYLGEDGDENSSMMANVWTPRNKGECFSPVEGKEGGEPSRKAVSENVPRFIPKDLDICTGRRHDVSNDDNDDQFILVCPRALDGNSSGPRRTISMRPLSHQNPARISLRPRFGGEYQTTIPSRSVGTITTTSIARRPLQIKPAVTPPPANNGSHYHPSIITHVSVVGDNSRNSVQTSAFRYVPPNQNQPTPLATMEKPANPSDECNWQLSTSSHFVPIQERYL